MNLSTILEQELLPLVEKPSRYIGTEINSVRKPDARVRLVLAFPDLYKNRKKQWGALEYPQIIFKTSNSR